MTIENELMANMITLLFLVALFGVPLYFGFSTHWGEKPHTADAIITDKQYVPAHIGIVGFMPPSIPFGGTIPDQYYITLSYKDTIAEVQVPKSLYDKYAIGQRLTLAYTSTSGIKTLDDIPIRN